MMKLNELRNEFIKQLNEYEYDEKMIDKLSNDVHMLLWIEHVMFTENMTIRQMFGDVGFIEGMECQYENPITFDEMK